MLNTIVIVSLYGTSSYANFINGRAEGWHWYEDPVIYDKHEDDNKKAIDREEASTKPETAQEILKAFQKELEEKKVKAVIFPTYENVKAYQELQQKLMERSTLFSKRWVEVVMTSPHLDYTLKRPITQVGSQVYDAHKKQALERKIKELSSAYGLFFFYSTGCPYCKTFAPVVKHFSEKYGWPVLAISIDGRVLPEFPEARPDNGAAQKLGVQYLPTLLAVHPETGTILPLSYRYNALDGIEKRIQVFWDAGRIQ